MSARERVLGNVRHRLGRGDAASTEADERLAGRAHGPLPARSAGTGPVLRERFVEMARAASAEVEVLEGLPALPALVARLCAEHGFAGPAVVAPTPPLQSLAWATGARGAEFRRAHAEDRLCVSHALCGIAETGTVCLASGPDSPITLNFLPDVQVIALDAGTIVGAYEQAWGLLRTRGPLPRAVNWITGPSRSADIEQTLQLGAHGPVRLVLALYG